MRKAESKDYRTLLKDKLAQRLSLNPSYSQRAFARDPAKAYPDFGMHLSSFTDSIVRMPGKRGVYQVTTSRMDGSDRMTLEVTVEGADTCYVGQAKVTSVIRK